jgi:hypothetical protein
MDGTVGWGEPQAMPNNTCVDHTPRRMQIADEEHRSGLPFSHTTRCFPAGAERNTAIRVDPQMQRKTGT